MRKNIDDMLRSTKKSDIPNSTFEKVDNVLKNLEQRKVGITVKKKSFRSVAIAACLVIAFLSVGVVYATVTGLWTNIFNPSDIGAKKPLQNDNVQNVSMEYVLSNGVGIKANSVILSDSKFTVVYEIKLPNHLPKCDWINFADLTVADENGIVLYGEVEGSLSTYESIAVEQVDDVTFKTSIVAENSNNTYPKNKKLYFTLSQIHCLNSENKIGNGVEQVEIYDGNWRFEVDMTER